ncbi:unnamed protein product [Orchesella dallaii]|uniref:BTB domain-containing protein n=1 Tax=Orchesella dallaii TaxID=48710 RepID=A0ABP1R9E0_9HEXA
MGLFSCFGKCIGTSLPVDEVDASEPNNYSKTSDDNKSISNSKSSQNSVPRSTDEKKILLEDPTPTLNSGNENNPEVTKVEWTSGARKEITEIHWKIKDFEALYELGELLRNETCVFTTGYSIGFPTRWCFNLQRMRQENNIGLFLKRIKPLSFQETVSSSSSSGSGDSNNKNEHTDGAKEDSSEVVYIHYEIVIKKSGHGDVWLHKQTCIPNFQIASRLGFRKLFTLEELALADQPQLNQNGKILSPQVPVLSDNNTLHVDIIFSLHLQSDENMSHQLKMNSKDKLSLENSERFHSQLLQKELGELLKSGYNADTILVLNDDTTFRVHKAVISARSPMFAAMFQSGMRESQTGVVRISDVNSKTMANVLCYIYRGKTDDIDWSNVNQVQQLIYAADKYSLMGLHDFCDKKLFNGCNEQNAMDLLAIAQAHNLTVATKDISLFIKM